MTWSSSNTSAGQSMQMGVEGRLGETLQGAVGTVANSLGESPTST